MFRNIVTSLLQYERIVTTEAKSKEVGRLAEKMITLGKRGDLHARRQAVAFIKGNEVVKKLFSVLAERYQNREGGYTRVLKLEPRSGDNAPMAMVELVDRPVAAKPAKGSKGRKADAKAPKKPAAKKTTAKKAAPKEEPAKKKAKAKPGKKAEASDEVKKGKKETTKKETAKKTAKKEIVKKAASAKKKTRESEDKA